jgi:omega-6 fatty acid desaturase (delta-12 desaturase)
MQALEYEILKKTIQKKKTNNIHAGLIILRMLILTFAMLYLSYTQSGIIWFVAQFFLGVLILQWFFLIHDFGHGHFFTSSRLNNFFGVLASLFVMLPFFSWKYIHRHHHLWTGWKDKDPTMSIIVPVQIPSYQKAIINFCWRFWIPIFSLSFSFSIFWNLPKLRKFFPQNVFYFIFSMSLICLTHLAVVWIFGWQLYLHCWVCAYVIFLVISDPLLLSQHVGIPQYQSHGKTVGQLHFREQGEFTRSLIFPNWIKTYILFGFNVHALHHLYPSLPGYQLCKITYKGENDIHWYEWLRASKKIPAIELLFSEEKIKD